MCSLVLLVKNSAVYKFYTKGCPSLHYTILKTNFHIISLLMNCCEWSTSGVVWLLSPSVSSLNGTLFFTSLRCFCAFVRVCHVLPRSHYWINCWFVSPCYSDPKYLYSTAHLSLVIIYSQYFKIFSHTLCFPVQICSLSRANCVSPFHFLLVFLPLDPFHPVQLWLQCSLSSHPNLSTLSSRLSFVLLFSISIQLSSFQDACFSLLASAFLSF